MGRFVFDRFRDLEKADGGRRLDVVLMATVSSFEALKRPTRHELKQFSHLFTPLFRQAGMDTQRTVAAALSRCTHVPADVVRLIVSQSIEVAAPFLANATTLDDQHIAEIVATQPLTHARALARRPSLSGAAVEALGATGDMAVLRSLTVRGLLPADITPAAIQADTRAKSEEAIRRKLRELVGKRRRQTETVSDRHDIPSVSRDAARRLARFAEDGEALFFTTALADALGCSFPFAERIMLDISGGRLAGTLKAIGFDVADTARILQSFFPHLGRASARRADARTLAARYGREDAAADLSRRLAVLGNEQAEYASALVDTPRPRREATSRQPTANESRTTGKPPKLRRA